MQTKFDIIIPPQDITCETGLQEKLANGDSNAFAWVYKNYCKRIYNYALLITNDVEQSEDIVQDVFIKLWLNKEKLTGVKDFNAYFYQLYRNQILDNIKAGQKEKSVAAIYWKSLPLFTNSVEEIIDCKYTQKKIITAIEQLPHQQKQTFTLREQDFKRSTIAQQLNKSENKVKGYLSRALRFLKEKIQ